MSNALEQYMDQRRILEMQHVGDGMGFYVADALLRIEMGMDLSIYHSDALEADRQQREQAKRWIKEQGDTAPF